MIDYEAAVQELRTINDLVRWGVSHFNQANLFFGHGSDNAIDESLALVLHVLNLEHGLPSELMMARLTSGERRAIIELMRRRLEERVPTAYLTHEAWFAGLKFYVDERVLVPRSPIAELIESGFEPWLEPSRVANILDLCTGSACIAIACAHTFPDAQVDAVDISDDALQVAEINVARYHLEDHVNLIQSDVFERLDEKKYDLIVSNPPYVDALDMRHLPREYKYEPALGLAAGEDGLDIVRRILKNASRYLTPEGILVVEVGNAQEAVLAQFPTVPFIWVDFEKGGEGVFIIDYETLVECGAYF